MISIRVSRAFYMTWVWVFSFYNKYCCEAPAAPGVRGEGAEYRSTPQLTRDRQSDWFKIDSATEHKVGAVPVVWKENICLCSVALSIFVQSRCRSSTARRAPPPCPSGKTDFSLVLDNPGMGLGFGQV